MRKAEQSYLHHERDGLRDRALEVLCSTELSPLVELVCWQSGPDTYEARSVDGYVRFRRHSDGPSVEFSVEDSSERNPLADQDPARFSPLAEEIANLRPDRSRNSYPYAYEHIAQIFDHPCAPDLCVLHTSSHKCEDHRGEHGSLGVVQARAPFVISGAGVRRQGLVDRHCRLVDVAPTVLSLLGIAPGDGVGPSGSRRPDAYLSRQDGDVVGSVSDPDAPRPDMVICFLLDGTNPNMLYDMTASGDAPTIAGLIEQGTAFRHGAIASLPTVTLPNHTSLLTGCHPGHHGVLHNAWYDRSLGRQVVTESASTWQEAMRWLAPGIQTVHEAIKNKMPEACTISVNEPADRGASYSTFDLFRTGRQKELAPLSGTTRPGATQQFVQSSEAYKWGTTIDDSSVAQACALLEGRMGGYPQPVFMWVNTTLTDSASHEAGPNSKMARAAVRDTDARIGDVLRAVDRTVGLAGTTVLVLADHGMELNDPDVTGDWGSALEDAGIPFRDEGSGFLYLGEEAAE
ncbi:MAG: alkaline phosphatase family protein [Acidimicrobiales bacterium]